LIFLEYTVLADTIVGENWLENYSYRENVKEKMDKKERAKKSYRSWGNSIHRGYWSV